MTDTVEVINMSPRTSQPSPLFFARKTGQAPVTLVWLRPRACSEGTGVTSAGRQTDWKSSAGCSLVLKRREGAARRGAGGGGLTPSAARPASGKIHSPRKPVSDDAGRGHQPPAGVRVRI